MGLTTTETTRAPTPPWPGFAMMCLGMFMAILDVQVVATSMPTIQKALQVTPDRISWIQTAYLIAEVIAIPLTGLLTRWLSMRWLFVAAVVTFTLASIGCAASDNFGTLVAWRVLQGFSGGTLIPAVFSAVFLLFPAQRQGIATTIAGVLAVLAPTIGPVVGGWITQAFSWQWLFLINVVPGFLAAAWAVWLLPIEPVDGCQARRIDLTALALMAVSLAALEVGLKEAPGRGWTAAPVVGLLALSLCGGALFLRRTLTAHHPIVELRTFADRRFSTGCLLSFVLGAGLFGSVYLMPVFLGFVRGLNALQIGTIMLVTGAAQLATAPLAVALERRMDARPLAGAGFALFAVGLGMSAWQPADAGFREMLWPQLVRGVAIMFCLLPPTRLALGHLETPRIPDASAVFNLMRNLGGAIGIALADTVIYGRSPVLAAAIARRLEAGDLDTAKAVGLPVAAFLARTAGPVDPRTALLIRPLVERLALAQAINEAWLMLAILTAAALLCLPLSGPVRRPAAAMAAG
jgi:DHA2 family multidrug resistance protein